jgi:hypothetical protein
MSLTTKSHKLFVARQEAAADSTFSDNLATEGDFGNKPTDTLDVLDIIRLDPNANEEVDPKVIANSIVNGIVFSFIGGNDPDDAFTWNVYGWRNENGPAELIANGTGILGTQAVVKYPHNPDASATDRFWADTLEVDGEYWMKEVEATAHSNNSVSKLWFDTCGYRYFYVEIPTSVGDMAVYCGYW